MEDIVTSLRSYKETKELIKLLRRLDPNEKKENNLSLRLLNLLHNEWLSSSEYLAIRAKVAMGQYVKLLNKRSPDLKCGIYLYDNQTSTVWNAFVSGLPQDFNEYTQGLDVSADIPRQSSEPDYNYRNLMFDDVARSEHPIVINHKNQYLKAGIHSFVTVPLRYKGQSIGHQIITSSQTGRFLKHNYSVYTEYSRLLVKELKTIKSFMILQIQSKMR